MATGSGGEKPPFDQLVSSVSPTVLRQEVGVRQKEAQKFTFAPSASKFRSVLKNELQCDLEKFGSFLGLPTARVCAVVSAADEDREKQIDYLLLAWVESLRECATIEEALRALYAADDTTAVENISNELSDSGTTLQRDVLVPKKPSYADSVVIPSPPTKTHFLVENEEIKLSQRLEQMTVVTNMTPQRLQSQSELTPVELPPDVSLQVPLEETSLTKNAVSAVEPPSEGADPDQSAEALMPVEESHLSPSVTSAPTSAVVSTFTNPQRVVTAVTDTTFEETHGGHEMVSGDRRMERMQSDIDDLLKNMTRVESGLEEVKSEHRRESLYQSQRSKELDAKLKQLEEDNETLKMMVTDLQNELKETKQKLMEALEEVTRLRDDKKDLNDLLMEERAQFREDREKLREENELLHKRAATTEREKAELRDALEEQATQWKSQQERYERELNEVKAMLQKVTREIRERRDQNSTDSPGESLQSQESETGEWVWKELLGSGGFGEVFKAQRKGHSDIFAAKRITFRDSESFDKNAEIVSSFLKEMKALQECRHPRIVQYIDRAIEPGRGIIYFYIVMEFMSQGSLSDLLKKENKLDELRVNKYTRQLLEGLQYLHKRSVIHRDVKCSNILLDDSGDIKLADFGCVKFSRSKVNSGVRMTGTAWWMAPELVPGGKQSDAASEKSDVWSVGATVVEMLTGKRPFYEYKEKMAVIFALGKRTLSLEELICGPGFSDEVQEFLRLCINWEPSQRATVAELLGTSFCSLE